jgi:uncharacterized SAM-binding protein YcdF (DUF218 family)
VTGDRPRRPSPALPTSRANPPVDPRQSGVSEIVKIKLRKLARLANCGLTGLGLVLLTVTFTPLVSWWAACLQGPWTEARGDILIVPAGSMEGAGILGESSYWRSFYAILAWREGGWRQIMITGGGPVPVAEVMRVFLQTGGVPPGMIGMDTESTSTRESALHVKAALENEPGSKVLLTSDYHMFRARRAFSRAGLDVIPRPVPDAGKRAHRWNLRWGAFQDLAIESGKIVYYRWRGWI